jgi:hypothetical protein
MMAPIYRQLAAIFQRIAARAQSLALQFRSKGIGGSPQLVEATHPGYQAVTIPSTGTYIERKPARATT